MRSSRGSSQPSSRTCIPYVSCIGRWVLGSSVWGGFIQSAEDLNRTKRMSHSVSFCRLLSWDTVGFWTQTETLAVLDSWAHLLFFFKLFILCWGIANYNVVTVQVNSEGTQPFICLYPFSPKLPSRLPQDIGAHLVFGSGFAPLVLLDLRPLDLDICTGMTHQLFWFSSLLPTDLETSQVS